MSLEREIKLPVSPTFAMPPLDDAAPGVRAVARGDATLHTVYFDAPDLRLVRAGASLRYREGQSWTVKLPAAQGMPLLAREEVEFPDDGGVVPRDALELLRAYLRTADVVPVLRLRTSRRRWDLVGDADRVVAELVDDDVEVVSGSPGRVRFRELEVEAKADGADRILVGVVARLRAAGAGEPDPTPKPARALGAIAAAPADVLVRDLPNDPTVSDVIRRAIARSVLHLIRHDPVVRLDAVPEGVHQARVATRRLRSDLRTFAPLLDDTWTRSVRDELAWLGDTLGAARDADVLLSRIRERVPRLAPTERPAAAEIVGALERRHKEAHAAVMEVLATLRYATLLDVLVDAANAPALTRDAARDAREVMPRLVRRPWKQLRSAVEEAADQPTASVLHGIRIRAKRLRYAADAVSIVAGRSARRLAAAAEEVQDVLGEHQDAAVASAWLRTWAVDRSADAAFAAGVLAGHEDLAAATARARWRDAWRALDRRELRGWM